MGGDPRPIRLGDSAARKRRRLEQRLEGRDPASLGLDEVVRDARVLGSLELAGEACTWEEARAAGRGEPAPEPARRLQRAARAVSADRPYGTAALLAWHEAALGERTGLRTEDAARAFPPPPAPAALLAERLELLEQWLGGESGLELPAAAQGALVLARLVEIQPFEDGNGRVARLAAAHLMTRAGADPPILVGGDAPRLAASLRAAFQLDTAPLVALLEEASERCLDVRLQALEAAPGSV